MEERTKNDSTGTSGRRIRVLIEDGTIKSVCLSDYRGFELPTQNEEIVSDLQNLKHLHEPGIYCNVEARYKSNLPYTRSGDMLISVNPFQWLKIYDTDVQERYAHELIFKKSDSDPRDHLEPHLFEVSALAYRGLFLEGYDQSILISGESGSGKTESNKLLLQFLARFGAKNKSKGSSHTLRCILEANPVLEAFGNAQTVRNSNSSRFGKYTQILFDHSDPRLQRTPKILGSVSSVYLLESSRIVRPEPRERNYHIFYQLLAAHDSRKRQVWKQLIGRSPENFKYLGCTDVNCIEGIRDSEHFEKNWSALLDIGISHSEIIELMRAVCIVLGLGNLIFDGDQDSSEIVWQKDEFEDSLMELMGISRDDLRKCLTQRNMTANNETFIVPVSVSDAKAACDAFAKVIYTTMFSWLVRKLNEKTSGGAVDSKYVGGSIGLLDIYGFEYGEKSNFGQFCINYANEKLQQKAINDVFRLTKEEYEYEGIRLDYVEFKDNEKVLNIIEGKMGIMSLLNEECFRPKGSGVSFAQKVLQAYENTPYVCPVKPRQVEFGVLHYAGIVVYDASNFVQSNQDSLPVDLSQCAKKFSNRIIAKHFDDDLATDSSLLRCRELIRNHYKEVQNGEEDESSKSQQDSNSDKQQSSWKKHSTIQNSPIHGPLLLEKSRAKVFNGNETSKNACDSSQKKMQTPLNRKSEPSFSGLKREQNIGRKASFRSSHSLSEFERTKIMREKEESFVKSRSSNVIKSRSKTSSHPEKLQSSGSIIGETVWTKYQEQLKELIATLSATKSRYVRCIKPNDIAEPRLMDQRKTIEQLKCAGIVATVKLSRAIYPSSMKNRVLRYRYDALWDKHAFPPRNKRVAKAELRYKIECEALLACALRTMELTMPDKTILPYVVGKTRTYFKSGALEFLESRRVLTLDNVAVVIQKLCRGYLARKRQAIIKKIIPVIQRWYRKVSETRKKTVSHQRRQFLETRRIFERNRSPILINRPVY